MLPGGLDHLGNHLGLVLPAARREDAARRLHVTGVTGVTDAEKMPLAVCM